MAISIQFWASDGPKGEKLIFERQCKVFDALASAATGRPACCVLVLMHDTRGKRTVEIWRKPGYESETGSGPGVLNVWKKHI